MRILGGKWKGKSLLTSIGRIKHRPTMGLIKSALFNRLAHHNDLPALEGSRFLDICCGPGGCGFEALSRGASWVTFVDRNPAAIRLVLRNGELVGLSPESNFAAILGDAARLRGGTVELHDIAFIDPPYRLGQELVLAIAHQLLEGPFLRPGGALICELDKRTTLTLPPPWLHLDRVVYGESSLHYFTHGGQNNVHSI